MTYTDKVFFEFPVKLYDPYSMAQSEMEEDKRFKEEGDLVAVPVQYLIGMKACIPTDIKGYVNNYHKGQPLEEVNHEGFPCTVVAILEGDEVNNYECTWTMEEFKSQLNKKMA